MSNAGAKWTLIIVAILAMASCVRAGSFRVVALPDTQGYSAYYPDAFIWQTMWASAHVEDMNIVFVTHLGDIVEHAVNTYEWENARRAMQWLRGAVPYGLSVGGHDYNTDNFLRYFGPWYFEGYSWFKGSSPSGMSSWQQISTEDYDLVFLHLLYCGSEEEFSWARQVLAQNKNTPTIISTHEYLDGGGRMQHTERIWNDIVRQNDQVFLVVCGHWYLPGEYNQTSVNNAGRKVYELLSDFQDEPYGGNGWMRLMEFVPGAGINVKTYSPKFNMYRTESVNQFSLAFDLAQRFNPPTSLRLLRPVVVSDFSSNATRDGWTRNCLSDGYSGLAALGDENSSMFRCSGPEGQGYLTYAEPGGGNADCFVAPPKFTGNLSLYDAIVLDYRNFTQNKLPDPPRIRLYSGNDYYEWRNTERVCNDGLWQRLVASLKDADFWWPRDSSTPGFDSFVQNVTEVTVAADLVSGPESTGIGTFALANCDSTGSTAVVSSFDSDADGWIISGIGNRGFDVRGCLYGVSPPNAGVWYFSAPAKFLGNKSGSYGSNLDFDLRQRQLDGQSEGPVVMLVGDADTLLMNMPASSYPDTTWTRYSVKLDDSADWIVQSTGLPATYEDFLSVLSTLNGLRIRGDYRGCATTCYLDNVVMSSGLPPIPSTSLTSLSQVNGMSDGTRVQIISCKSVTADSGTFSDGSYYVEESNRRSGLKVVPAPNLQGVHIGQKITGSGTLATDSEGQRYLNLDTVHVRTGTPLGQIGMSNAGVLQQIAPIGSLVTVWGKVVESESFLSPPGDTAYVYIDDGSTLQTGAHQGIRIVLNDLNTPISHDLFYGAKVAITGILGKGWDGTSLVPVVRPRGDADIRML